MIDFTLRLRTQFRLSMGSKGACCPVCDRFGKIYPTRLNSTMVRILAWMHLHGQHNTPGAYINFPRSGNRFICTSNCVGKMVHWGLVQSMPNNDPEKASSGHWRLTVRGEQFIMGNIEVPRRKYLYNNQAQLVADADTATVSAADALASGGFKYSEVMAPATWGFK